jgi:hypothetical protein
MRLTCYILVKVSCNFSFVKSMLSRHALPPSEAKSRPIESGCVIKTVFPLCEALSPAHYKLKYPRGFSGTHISTFVTQALLSETAQPPFTPA